MKTSATTSFRVPVAAPAVPSPGKESVAASSANKPEHASCTPLQKPKDPRAMAGLTAQAKETFSDTIKTMQKNQEKAKARDVNIAKKTFWRKALGVVAAATAFGVALGLAISTGGALLPVVIAVVGLVVLKMSVADAWVAHMSCKNAQARKRGETTMPYNIPLEGASATANLLCWMFTKAGMNEEKAKKIAVYSDAAFRLSLTVTTAAATLGASLATDVVLSNADRIIPVLSTAASLFQSIADMKVDEARTNEDEKTAKQIAEIQRQFDELQEANTLKEEEIAALQAKIDQAAAELPVTPIDEQPLLAAQPVQAQQAQEEQPAPDLWDDLRFIGSAAGQRMASALLPRDLLALPQVQSALQVTRTIFNPTNLANLQREYGEQRRHAWQR